VYNTLWWPVALTLWTDHARLFSGINPAAWLFAGMFLRARRVFRLRADLGLLVAGSALAVRKWSMRAACV